MRSLACELGLSPMTISRVLNGSSMVRPETRSLVLTKVRELGYDCDAKLRKPKSEKAKNVAIHCGAEKLSSEIPFDFYPQLYYHCLHRLKALGLKGHLVDLNANSEADEETLESCASLIALSKLSPERWAGISKLRDGRKTLDVFGEIDADASIGPDEVGGGELAAKRILEEGCGHCACFVNLEERGFRQRYAGFAALLAGAPREIRVDLVPFKEVPAKAEADVLKSEALDKYLAACGKSLPEAFFAPGGYSAQLLYRKLRGRGLSMPEDFLLIGYDDFDYLKSLDQSIARVVFDVKELAVKAAEAMAGLLDPAARGRVATKSLIPVKLVDGDGATNRAASENETKRAS